LLDDPDFQTLPQPLRTKIDLGIELLEAAIRHKVPLSVLLFDSWYLADALVSMARYHKKDWISLLKKKRNLETYSFVLKDAAGQPIPLAGPHIAVADLVPLIPPTAYREVTVGDKTSWTFTLTVRLPGLGKVRLVVSFKSAELTGTAAVLVTNRADWSAQRIIALYLPRWPIETCQSCNLRSTLFWPTLDSSGLPTVRRAVCGRKAWRPTPWGGPPMRGHTPCLTALPA